MHGNSVRTNSFPVPSVFPSLHELSSRDMPKLKSNVLTDEKTYTSPNRFRKTGILDTSKPDRPTHPQFENSDESPPKKSKVDDFIDLDESPKTTILENPTISTPSKVIKVVTTKQIVDGPPLHLLTVTFVDKQFEGASNTFEIKTQNRLS
jgi:hypothetical protein